jgi:uncharacterized ubiquitin-like protein YukD
MNKLTINSAVLASFLLLIVVSCEKESQHDYRDIYVGKYDFHIKYHFPTGSYIDSIHDYIWVDSNYSYEGSIIKSDEKDKIIVDWGNDTLAGDGIRVFTQKSEFAIDSTGNLSYPFYPEVGHTRFWPPSYINNDTLRFTIGSGGMMYYSIWEVYGLKKNY